MFLCEMDSFSLKEKNTLNDTSLSFATNEILVILLYFDIFKYPLKIKEIIYFSKYNKIEVQKILNKLIKNNIVFSIDEFFTLEQNSKNITNRIKSNKRAEKILPKAMKIANFISKFPFVTGVFISGSLSKGCFAKNDDIDYFIITKPSRLWIARTFLILYKKIFLLNSKKYFCVNYFMSEDNLTIPQQNRFTATECATLIPVKGKDIYQKLLQNNSWVLDYFPNIKTDKNASEIKHNRFKKITEFLLNGKIGNFLETYFMQITKKHQKKKFKKFKKEEFELAFKGDATTSKHHPQNHQLKTMDLLNLKIKKFNKKYQLNIPLE